MEGLEQNEENVAFILKEINWLSTNYVDIPKHT